MNKNSPFAVWMRTSGYCALVSLALVCYLFATSNSPAQYALTVVVAVLLFMLSVCIGFYFGVQRYHDKQHGVFVRGTASQHYPQRAAFEQRAIVAAKNQTVRVTRIDTFA